MMKSRRIRLESGECRSLPSLPTMGAWVLRIPVIGLCLTALMLSAGCAVPQPRGQGELRYVTEPTTKRNYYLYLPSEYVQTDDAGRRARRWPTVVTFHGMKPFDWAHSQAREWEQEADRYGFVVVAPELTAPSVLKQFPVRHVTDSFREDEAATLAILDHVFATTQADPENVLATSWSSGGYLAHYMVNHHPGRFSCLAVRQSNFSDEILDPAMAARSRNFPILVIYTQHDFGIVKTECQTAVKWYESHGYTHFGWVELRGLGHERTPDAAAAFFANFAGVEPNTPPVVLLNRQAMDGNARGIAFMSERSGAMNEPAQKPAVARNAHQNRRPAVAAAPPTNASQETDAAAVRSAASYTDTTQKSAPSNPAVAIRVSSAIGTQPLLVAFSADCPTDWRRSGSFLWTLDGEPIGRGLNGQKTIADTGEHTLALLVTTVDGESHRAFRLIRVLPALPPEASAANGKQ